jgi:hypothetical protein
MTHKLIKTDNYLLVVDDSDIKVGDYFYSIREIVEQAVIDYPKNEHHGVILAHLPLNGAPILEGVDLLPPYSRHQEDGLEDAVMEFKERYGSLGVTDYELSAFSKGYNKAREKFLSELHTQILDFTHDLKQDPSQHRHFEGALFGLNRLKYYLSKYPTEFECETSGGIDDFPTDTPKPKTITTKQGVQWVGRYK